MQRGRIRTRLAASRRRKFLKDSRFKDTTSQKINRRSIPADSFATYLRRLLLCLAVVHDEETREVDTFNYF